MQMQSLSRAMRNAAAVFFAATLSLIAFAQAPTQFLGVITEIHGNTLTLKSDKSGTLSTVTVPSEATLLRIAPGQKDISTAQPLTFDTLKPGDRVLVRVTAAATGASLTANRVIAIKQEDLAEKQKADLEDWQKRGITGVVRSIDTTSGEIAVAIGRSQSSHIITLHTSKSTAIRRYATDSTQFADAHTATLAEIHKGDQLRARGNKSDDGQSLAAEDVVCGSFRTFAGTVISVDTAASTLILNDLATKKPFEVHIKSDSNLRRLPDAVAQHMAARMGSAAQPAAGQHPNSAPKPADAGSTEQGSNRSPESFINQAPEFKLSDLKKGDALLLLTTEGTPTSATAITVLSGVDALLRTAPGATQKLMQSSWGMEGGAAEAQ